MDGEAGDWDVSAVLTSLQSHGSCALTDQMTMREGNNLESRRLGIPKNSCGDEEGLETVKHFVCDCPALTMWGE